ncbi:uncharacterized protein A4U43_C07F25430 [Asparagus officinalis]|uniref:Uncharacterized protein n=1 Tax=Asparagus officinalis TaxID=4686 RepID=A0A5P1EGR7_ASPOF|nr:uncharacterized protein A4U43_C07F25430 [Asparagus officinalis]
MESFWSAVMAAPGACLPSRRVVSRIRMPNIQNYVQVLFVYRRGREAAKVIKQALSRALVPYYPVAGRLRRSRHRDDHKEVYCSDDGGGVVFIEASADRGLEDSGYYPDRLPLYDIPREQLLPSTPTEAEPHKPIFLMQVLNFSLTCDRLNSRTS